VNVSTRCKNNLAIVFPSRQCSEMRNMSVLPCSRIIGFFEPLGHDVLLLAQHVFE
jgi:hypothetical protein